MSPEEVYAEIRSHLEVALKLALEAREAEGDNPTGQLIRGETTGDFYLSEHMSVLYGQIDEALGTLFESYAEKGLEW